MSDPYVPTKLDLGIIHALQVAPRAPWALIGQVLEVDAATVARRWARLDRAGLAWLSAYPWPRNGSGLQPAFVEVQCDPGGVGLLGATVARDPRVVTVAHMTGSRDLLLSVVTDSARATWAYVERLRALDGLRSLRVHVVTRAYADGSRWRVRALSVTQQHQFAELLARTDEPLRSRDRPAKRHGRDVSPEHLQELSRALAADPRISVIALAEQLGCNRATAARRLGLALSRGDLVLRCDVARELTDWPVSETFWMHLPHDGYERRAVQLSRLPDVRQCVGLTGGPANLLTSFWMRDVENATQLEGMLLERVPGLRILDSGVAMRFSKRMGQLFDDQERPAGFVPIDPWAEPTE
jgi:DNA-binding Lrp family transcriptional regulator